MDQRMRVHWFAMSSNDGSSESTSKCHAQVSGGNHGDHTTSKDGERLCEAYVPHILYTESQHFSRTEMLKNARSQPSIPSYGEWMKPYSCRYAQRCN